MNRLQLMAALAALLAAVAHVRITVYVAGVIPLSIPVLPAIFVGAVLAAAAACWVVCRAVRRWPHLHTAAAR